ncbi:hypothetical protein [Stieleria mannarensis]|uniref:hypothetical protein n=1 Tax=Stieleria mannarensis TaxID=2755585 RepID=UPI0016026FFD|nr:hypothetical protein [Rhodopirellula sp. JC639]
MPASKLSDLLPIRTATGKPNAYQVFGLKSGESDGAKITAAIKRVYQTLKESRSTADPTVWKQAATLAEAARKQLEDPQQRRALESRLAAGGDSAGGSTAGGDTAGGSTATSEPEDPLASLLPRSKPLSDPPATDSAAAGSTPQPAAAVLGMPPGLSTPARPATPASVLGTPPLGTPAQGMSATGAPAPAPAQPAQPTPTSIAPTENVAENAAVTWTPPKKQKPKRRRKKTGVFLFALFVIVMLGAIVGLLQFLTQGGQIALRPPGDAGGGIVVGQPNPAPQQPRPAAPNSDGVLGNVAASGIADSLRRPQDDTPADSPGMQPPPVQSPGNQTPPNTMPVDGMPPAQPPMNSEPPPADTATPDPTPSPAPSPTTPTAPETMPPETMPPETMPPAAIAANQEKIEAVEQLIRAADWEQMKPAAEALLKLKLNAQQSKRASSLYDIADLASFYRGAIGRGLATLNTGGTFDYVEGIPVIVVEVSPEELTIKFNNRTRSFTVDEMPPRLTEKITSFALSPERPDAIAGQALYRLIHPKWRAEYRDDTFEVLASVDGELEQVDTAMLQQVAKELFPK